MHDFTRRRLLQGGAVLAAGATLSGEALLDSTKVWAAESPFTAEPENPAQLAINDFKPFVGASFDLHEGDGEGKVELTLSKVVGVGGGYNRKNAAFSLLFSAASNKKLTQKTYTVTHGSLGGMKMFLVPVGEDKYRRYEAIFT